MLKAFVLGICLLLATGLLQAEAAESKRVALVVGNGKYSYPASTLKNPVNDAQDIATVLKRLKFSVILGIDVDVAKFTDLLAKFSRELAGADVGLFYFAGHGLQFDNANYLLATDAKIENKFRVKQEAVEMLDVISTMEANAQTNLVFLDACRNNPFAERLARSLASQGRSAVASRGLAPISRPGYTDTLITYATAPGDVADDGEGRNSPFTAALLRHIELPGVEIELLLKKVTADVLKATGRKQAPERLSHLTSEFYFIPPKYDLGSGSTPVVPSAKAPTTSRLPSEGQKPFSGEKNASAWVKLCEVASMPAKQRSGQTVNEQKQICLTHHERLDGNTGLVLVSAALRHVEGQDKEHFMVMVPLGMAVPPGVRAAVYSKEQWAKAAKNEQVDEKSLKPVELKFSLCHPAGCTAEIEATSAFIDSMRTGGGLMVLALNAKSEAIAFPVPLDGFREAYVGPPVDNKAYAEARGKLMKEIRERQQSLAPTESR